MHARLLHGRTADSPRGDKHAGRAPRGSNAISPTIRSRSRRPDAVAVRPCLGRRVGEERVTFWIEPPPSPHRAVYARVLRGRSSDYPPGDERAGRPPREPNAVSSTVRSRSRRPDAVAVRLSLGHGAGENRVPRWLHHNQDHTSQCTRVLCGRLADSPRSDEREGRAPWDRTRYHRWPEATAADMTRWPCGRALADEPGNSDRAVHARVLCGRSSDSPRGDERAGHAPQEPNAASPPLRSRSRHHDAVAVRPSRGHGAGGERIASWPAPQPSPHRAVHARVLPGRSSDSQRSD